MLFDIGKFVFVEQFEGVVTFCSDDVRLYHCFVRSQAQCLVQFFERFIILLFVHESDTLVIQGHPVL